MAFITKRCHNKTNYYYLVKSIRVDGKPRQEIIKYLGNYVSAVAIISKSRIKSDKQKHLTRLAKLEGRFNCQSIPFPEKVYQCIVVDPPWHYSLRNSEDTHRNRIPYKSMELEDIKNLPIPELCDRQGCVVWLWFTNNHIVEASECIQYWGLKLKTILTWEKICKNGKTRLGTGHWLRNSTEHCILATFGHLASFSGTKTLTNQPTIIKSQRREHSRKPEEFYRLAENLQPDAARLEMFARKVRQGWNGWGDELS